MGLGLGLGLGPALGACWPLPEAQNLLKTGLFHRVHVLFKNLTRRRPALSAEGTKLVKITQKLGGQNGSDVAPFDLLTPAFDGTFQCAKLF